MKRRTIFSALVCAMLTVMALAAAAGAATISLSNSAPSGADAGSTTGDYHFADNAWHIHPTNNSDVILITGSTTTQRVIVDEGKTARIKLSNASIAPNGPTSGLAADRGKGRPLSVSPNAALFLTLEGTNTLRAPLYSTALFCPRYATLFIDGNGTLNAETSQSFGVAAIGGEGRINDTVYGWVGEVTTREWENDDDSAWCGKITINSGIVNAKVNSNKTTGEDSDTIDVAMEYMLYNWSVAIGGINGGPIIINGDSLTSTQVTATGGDKSTGIGSLSPLFEGGIKINGGTVNAYTNVGPNSNNAMSDHNTGGSYGAAIGWAAFGVHGGIAYNGSVAPGDSKIVIDITGGKVTAYGGWGCAGIGGGRNGSGGYIHIGGTADVNAKGGTSAAGIGGGIAFNPCLASTTMGTGTILIDGSATVVAEGGTHAAGIGGGGCRNNTAKAGDRNEAHSGTIIIAGNADVTATGSYNGPAIGSGGGMSSQNSKGACKVQGITITTTVPVKTRATGTGAITNIGPGAMPDNASDSPNQSATDRFTGVYINTNPQQQDPKIVVNDSITIDSNGDLIVTGNVDITSKQFSQEQAKVISQGIIDYLAANKGNVIKAASNGAEVKLATGYTLPSKQVDQQGLTVSYDTPKGGADPIITAPDPSLVPDNGNDGGGGNDSGGGNNNNNDSGNTGEPERPAPILPPLSTEQQQYRPEEMSSSELIANLKDKVSIAPELLQLDPGGASGGSGVNIVISGGDGTTKSLSNDKVPGFPSVFEAGQNIVQEIYILKPDGPSDVALNDTHSLNGKAVSVDVMYGSEVLLSFSDTIDGGHMSVKVPTNDVIAKLSDRLNISQLAAMFFSTFETQRHDLSLRIYDASGAIDVMMPITITFEMSEPGGGGGWPGSTDFSSSGGGGCISGGAALIAAIGAGAVYRKRYAWKHARSYKCRH